MTKAVKPTPVSDPPKLAQVTPIHPQPDDADDDGPTVLIPNDADTAPVPTVTTKGSDLDAVAELAEAHDQILREIEKRIIGQRSVIEQLLVALFARGHTLFVGVPGLAKTPSFPRSPRR